VAMRVDCECVMWNGLIGGGGYLQNSYTVSNEPSCYTVVVSIHCRLQ